MRHRPQLETVRQRALDDAWKVERAVSNGNGETAAIDWAHETRTSAAPASASSRRPRGTTLNDTDGA
ncbi:MAG TPA: hypothetical protein VFZ38_04270, partial [Vicinamibacterales bacterium]